MLKQAAAAMEAALAPKRAEVAAAEKAVEDRHADIQVNAAG